VKPIFFASPAKWRAWLEKNHHKKREVLVGFYKRATGKPSLTWPESVDGALCFGWIDGIRRSVDGERYTIRFTPRKPRSIWSDINTKRVAVLKKEGLMHESGLRAFAERDAKRSGIYSYERKNVKELPAPLAAKVRANAKAWAHFSSQAPWYQRAVSHWIATAKKEETRDKRLALLIASSAAGERIPPLRERKGATS